MGETHRQHTLQHKATTHKTKTMLIHGHIERLLHTVPTEDG